MYAIICSSRRRHTRCALVTGVQTCALPISRAAISHLWFESIHPFVDGNGRIGRAIAEKALAQNLAAPTLTALSETIHRHRKAYYAALQLGSQSNDINAWLTWFADI